MTEHSNKRAKGPDSNGTTGARKSGHGSDSALAELQRRAPGRAGSAAPPVERVLEPQRGRHHRSGGA